MAEFKPKDTCSEDCGAFTGKLFFASISDVFVCDASGYTHRPFYMPAPHGVHVGDECKFKDSA